MNGNRKARAALAATLALGLGLAGVGMVGVSRAEAAGAPIIGGGFGFPSSAPIPGRTVLRVSVNPNGVPAASLKVVECYRGNCLFAVPATTGFFQATFTGPPPLGARVSVLVVACSRLGCSRAVRSMLVSQPGSG